jgi:hypothetical protein
VHRLASERRRQFPIQKELIDKSFECRNETLILASNFQQIVQNEAPHAEVVGWLDK